MSAFPDIHVELSATTNIADFLQGHFDIGFRYLRAIPSGLHAATIGTNHIFPICSPALMTGPRALRTPAVQRNFYSKLPSV